MFFRKYIAQQHDWDCSPIALINALIWMKGTWISNLSVREQAALACGTDEEGTHDEDLVQALLDSIEINDLDVDVSRFESNDWPESHREELVGYHFAKIVKLALKDSSRAVILGHREVWLKDPEWHHSIFVKSFKVLFWRFYVGINMKAGKRFSIISEKMFERILLEADSDGPVTAWVLQKK
jgi:hypothetical protein